MMHPTWPGDAGGWVDLLLVVFISAFLWRKAWLMWRRSIRVDRLGLALIVVNATFAAVYLISACYQLWPELLTVEWLRRLIRIAVAAVVFWCWIQMEAAAPARVRSVTDDPTVE